MKRNAILLVTHHWTRDPTLHAFQVGGASGDAFGSLAAMAWESRCCGVGSLGDFRDFWGFWRVPSGSMR